MVGGQRARGAGPAAVLWTGGEGCGVGRMLAAGAGVWLAYAVAWLAIHGPALDESAIAAPVIAGGAGYPPGHPNVVIYRTSVLLLYRLAALQWWLHPDPWWISGTRNILFLFLSTIVPFTVVVACTRRPAWGHVAVALTLSETICSAVGVYLMWIFPGVTSSGHVGIHVAVLAVVLVAAGFDRLGGFLAGLVPAVHATMTAVAWPATLGVLLLRHRRGESALRVVQSALAGVAIAVAVAGLVSSSTAGDVTAPPYDRRGDGTAIVQTFVRTTDPHRQPLPFHSPIGLVGPIAFAALSTVALAERRLPARRVVEAVVLTGAIAWAYALGGHALQAVGALPLPVLLIAMPARFANVGMLLLVPLAVVVLATGPARTTAAVAAAIVAAEAVLLLTARELAFMHLLYAILGVALGVATAGPRRLALAGAVALLLALVSVRAANGSAVWPGFVLGFVPAAAVVLLMPARRIGTLLGAGIAVGCTAVAAIAIVGPHRASIWDFGSERMSAEERALGGWLARNAPPRTMLVTPPFPPTWLQPKTGHPVLVDTITLLTLPYFPREAEPIGRLLRDVYDIDYADPSAIAALEGPDGMLRPSSPAWTRTWRARSCETWREIAARWTFSYVLSLHETPLRLPAVWSGPTWTLYEVPGTCATT